MFSLSTSYRERNPKATFAKAIDFAKDLGIVRVADITQLDRIGLPVFASIRPNAHVNSLCVHAGKGLSMEDARTSALMEGIEFAIVEKPNSKIITYTETPLNLFGIKCKERLIEFCPMHNSRIPANQKMEWIDIDNLIDNNKFPTPKELVLFPLPSDPNYISYFGASTNGLASGNSLEEASIHGLLEVIERDIESFRLVKDESILVSNESLPKEISKLVTRIEERNFKFYCRYVPNQFSIPYFCSFILDSHPFMPVFASEGFGCHPNKKIALVRSITEAAQSRLSHIHGGRDDIINRYYLFSPKEEAEFNEKFETKVSRGKKISFNEIESLDFNKTSSETMLNELVNLLKNLGFKKVGRITLTSKQDPVSVVRIIVPQLESLNSVTKKVGRRLAECVAQKLT